MAGFSDSAAQYHLSAGPSIPAWMGQRRDWRDDLQGLIKTLAPAIENLFAQNRQDKIAEALMTGIAPRAEPVLDQSGNMVSGGPGMDAAGVDQYNASIGAGTSADVFQGSPEERLKLSQIIQKQRERDRNVKHETLMDTLREERAQQVVSGRDAPGGSGVGNGGGFRIPTPFGLMTPNQWSDDPRNPEGRRAFKAKALAEAEAEKTNAPKRAELDKEIQSTQSEVDQKNEYFGPDWMSMGRESNSEKLKRLQGERSGLTTKPDISNPKTAAPVPEDQAATGPAASLKRGVAGYVPGKKYAGRLYLGGDPYDEGNWQ